MKQLMSKYFFLKYVILYYNNFTLKEIIMITANPYKEAMRYMDNANKALKLAGKDGNFYVDEKYILYAIGLLSETAPTAALKIAKRHLKRVVA